jgi:hypothetical protein
MDKLSTARAAISKEERDRIIEDIRRKDGSVPMPTFVRWALDKDRLKTALYERLTCCGGIPVRSSPWRGRRQDQRPAPWGILPDS